MKRKIITTADGANTIKIENWNEQYHSIHGAIREAKHVFIEHGLRYVCQIDNKIVDRVESQQEISVLEIGFGTGLNALITCLEAVNLKFKINYVGVDAYPVSVKEIQQLNYPEKLKESRSLFSKIHDCSWEKPYSITSNFKLTKQERFFENINETNAYHLIYFDAFGARVQPELWTESIFTTMYNALTFKGVLVTYSAKGSVRRALQSVGFVVERLVGPPGKREMLRAIK